MYKINKRITMEGDHNDVEILQDVTMYPCPTFENLIWRFANTNEFKRLELIEMSRFLNMKNGEEVVIKNKYYGIFEVLYYVIKTE